MAHHRKSAVFKEANRLRLPQVPQPTIHTLFYNLRLPVSGTTYICTRRARPVEADRPIARLFAGDMLIIGCLWGRNKVSKFTAERLIMAI
ncbi:hypothetical protein PGTUg99_025687 [Puccinia graminis f. sp. tritici]|uniref:Uncharacterized protein n=1 Tax=Puccinia graminis f. sp. tritici TaxID=56615 RepID=A0A5B0Q963_PUCGR|nr:hypothetical protein PGTUg99_025687 [Puccinia graminis f. sp. tritici]